jgi:putative Mn2+ efflux pump MntP
MGALVHLLLIGLAANLDNLGVGAAYGVRRIRIPILSNLVIAGIAFAFTLISVWAGDYTSQFLSRTTANWIGAVLLMGVGLYTLFQEPADADLDGSGEIGLSESLVLGVALSINCLSNGFSAGLWGLGALATATVTALFSVVTLGLGLSLGLRQVASQWGRKATVLAGCLLIALAVHQVL